MNTAIFIRSTPPFTAEPLYQCNGETFDAQSLREYIRTRAIEVLVLDTSGIDITHPTLMKLLRIPKPKKNKRRAKK